MNIISDRDLFVQEINDQRPKETIEDGITEKSERYERSFLVKNEEEA